MTERDRAERERKETGLGDEGMGRKRKNIF